LSWAKDIGGKMQMWLGEGRSFLCYLVSSGRLMNMVAFVPTNLESEESWTAPGDLNTLAAEYAGWEATGWIRGHDAEKTAHECLVATR
jgi:salicylate hydroxylase